MPGISFTPGANLTLVPAATTAQFLRVSINSSGLATIAGIALVGIGISQDYGTTSDRIPIRLFSAEGTQIGTASEAIAVGDTVYTAASGKFSKTAGGGALIVGLATKAAGADGDQFEFVYVKQA